MSVQADPRRPGTDLLRTLVGGFAAPLRHADLLSQDQPFKPSPPVRRWRYHPVIRFLIFALVTVVAALVLGALLGIAINLLVGRPITDLDPVVLNALGIPAFVVGYLVTSLGWEQRRRTGPYAGAPSNVEGLYELAPRRAGGLLVGLAWGAALQLACVGVLALVGAYQVQGFDSSYNPIPMLLGAGFGAAINEEILFRGILYRLLEDTLGTWIAVAISGLVFGLAHVGNAQGSLQGGLAIALEAGVLFAALYALTRSLWLVMGLHFAWNMVQGPVLGIVVSGSAGAGQGYVRSALTGPEWLSGGPFGMEASLVTVVILTGLAAWILVVVRREGLVVAPFWVRRRAQRLRTPEPPAAEATAA